VTFLFLSDEWLEMAAQVRAESTEATPAAALAMNLVVTEVPFGESPMLAHVDTTKGPLYVDRGHHAKPDLTVTVDYATAKALLIEGNGQAAMSAFMAGKVRVEGDMSKLVALQNATPDAASVRVVERLRAQTT
jgi:putative sterol carrier protein